MDAPETTWARVVTEAYGTLAEPVPDPVPLDVVAGRVPDDLRGTYLRNGPGRQERGGVSYGHPFDGDGYVQQIVFNGKNALFRGRFVQTHEFQAEEAAGQILFRGFGTNRPGGLPPNALRMHFKNAANTHIIHHAGRLLALWEGGLPHRLDPDDLSTLGRYDYEGALRETAIPDRWIRSARPFSAHPSVDPETGELWNFGTAFGVKNKLLIHRVDRAGRLTTRDIVLDGLPFVHDFVLTRRYAVFALPSVRFDVPRALLGLKTPVESLTLTSEPGTALIVPRDGGEPIRVPIPPGFVFHWAEGWEEGDRLVLDGVKYQGFPDLSEPFESFMGPDGGPHLLARPVRLTIDHVRGTADEAPLAAHAMELPRIIGRGAARVIFATGAPPDRIQPFYSSILRLDPDGAVVERDLGDDLPGEPLPAGRWLLVPVWCAPGHSELHILDAANLELACRLRLPVPVPPPLHGSWIPAAE